MATPTNASFAKSAMKDRCAGLAVGILIELEAFGMEQSAAVV
jgi:hypothetical protein